MGGICNFDYGYCAYLVEDSSQVKACQIPVVKKGISISDLKTPIWCNRPMNVFQRGKSETITVFMNDGKSNTLSITLTNHTVEELFPNVVDYQNYFIGYSLDEKQIPILHIKDENGVTASTSLLEYWEKIF